MKKNTISIIFTLLFLTIVSCSKDKEQNFEGTYQFMDAEGITYQLNLNPDESAILEGGPNSSTYYGSWHWNSNYDCISIGINGFRNIAFPCGRYGFFGNGAIQGDYVYYNDHNAVTSKDPGYRLPITKIN